MQHGYSTHLDACSWLQDHAMLSDHQAKRGANWVPAGSAEEVDAGPGPRTKDCRTPRIIRPRDRPMSMVSNQEIAAPRRRAKLRSRGAPTSFTSSNRHMAAAGPRSASSSCTQQCPSHGPTAALRAWHADGLPRQDLPPHSSSPVHCSHPFNDSASSVCSVTRLWKSFAFVLYASRPFQSQVQ